MGPVAAVSSGRGQQRGYDRGQATIKRRRETSPRQPLQEGRLHNQGSESKILRWSHRVLGQRIRHPLLPSYGAIRDRIESLQAPATSSKTQPQQVASASPATSETPVPRFRGRRGEWGRFRDSFEYHGTIP
ncbi:hypothetical protein WN51_09001 [Melipona quadrifasciata]|uniref:Uncharacterized protein n=1 Tax=Melipona quadrifasciata TaxID=166423 RepID=A0A0M9A9Q5_9HYME|nr:hypothetical protein WN51_09001 [Melipona quadrifasciata]